MIAGGLNLWGLTCGEFQFLRKQNETQVCVVGKSFPNYTAAVRFPAGISVPVRRAARWLCSLVRVPRGALPAVAVFPKGISYSMATISRADLKKLRKRRARLKKKKMTCQFSGHGSIPRPVYVDYKDLKTLRTLIDREGRILPRRRTGTSALYQRAVRTAVLRARFIGLLPFVAEE